jgi:hypothetical protein
MTTTTTEALTPELGRKIHDKREDALLKLARLVLWLDWLDPVVGEPINHHIIDGLFHERDELIRQVVEYTDLLDRVMDECGGY